MSTAKNLWVAVGLSVCCPNVMLGQVLGWVFLVLVGSGSLFVVSPISPNLSSGLATWCVDYCNTPNACLDVSAAPMLLRARGSH